MQETSSRSYLAEYPVRLSDFWEILVRRKKQFLVPFAAILAVTLALAFLLPPTYKSEATFLVQRQSIPQDMVESTINSFVEEQIEQIRQRLLARDTLLEIARKFDLYAEALEKDPAGTVRKLRDDVQVEMVEVRASDPNRRTSQQVTTIAFTVAFQAPTAETAQAATNELAQRFLAEHQARRDAQAQEVSLFLEQQAAELATEIARLEAELASFKQKELRQLPELMNTNLRLYEKTEQDIDGAEEQIRSLREQIDVARAELSLTPKYEAVTNEEGNRVLSAPERLSVLTAEYFRASSRYSPMHPDIVRLRREIGVLAEQLGGGGQAEEMLSELVNLQEQLREARGRYAGEHPQVRRLENAVAAVQRSFRAEVVEEVGSGAGSNMPPPNNPRYVALQTQLKSSEAALQAKQQELEDLKSRLAQYESRLYETPAVERDFRSLTRNYETAVAQYQELRDKQRRAELARNLESGQSGEKFVLTSSAYLPLLPVSPNRIGIGLLGMLLALAGGVGAVALAEHLDTTIRSGRMVVATLGAPPLAVVPRLVRRWTR